MPNIMARSFILTVMLILSAGPLAAQATSANSPDSVRDNPQRKRESPREGPYRANPRGVRVGLGIESKCRTPEG
uniref:Uncharacterized protein n=1 Tax=Desulfovibrio sp. U5L TaxID=596152 RepID=I2PX47_9BACT